MNAFTPIGINTHSQFTDFYVYEWVIRETGEIFYVGKGRGNRAYEYHYNNENAERIRAEHDTEVIILKDNLSEEDALILETHEILRIKTETTWILTNVSTPQGVSNAWSPSKSTPSYSFETVPLIYTSDVEEHYFGMSARNYDTFNPDAVKSVYINDRMVQPEIKKQIFGDRYEQYYEETIQLLKRHGIRVLSSQYAKSVSAWIYCGNLSLWLYEDDQKKAEERIGHRVTAVHIIDVWKTLKALYNNPLPEETDIIEIHPTNTRLPLSKVPQFADEMDALRAGSSLLHKGFNCYESGNVEEAIAFFDKARAKGCMDPSMFHYYAVMFRKLKDYDNEIDILSEAILRYQSFNQDIYGGHILKFKERRDKAMNLLKRTQSKKQ